MKRDPIPSALLSDLARMVQTDADAMTPRSCEESDEQEHLLRMADSIWERARKVRRAGR